MRSCWLDPTVYSELWSSTSYFKEAGKFHISREQTKHDIKELEESDLEGRDRDEVDAFSWGMFAAFWNVTMWEKEGKVKWLLAESCPRASWIDTFNGCHLLLCDVKTSEQICPVSRLPVPLNLVLRSAFRLPWIQVDHGAIPSEKEGKKRARPWTQVM